MSKEEILQKYLSSKDYSFGVLSLEDCEKAMQEFADEHSAQIAVEFAGWMRSKHVNLIAAKLVKIDEQGKRILPTSSDLYQYWLTNVKNK